LVILGELGHLILGDVHLYLAGLYQQVARFAHEHVPGRFEYPATSLVSTEVTDVALAYRRPELFVTLLFFREL
jgi:hypothetical protein